MRRMSPGIGSVGPMTAAGEGNDELSPAQRYAAARRRTADRRSPLAAFRRNYPFDLDDFQVEACQAVLDGRGVLVAAPTGSGKTVVGEFAVYLALDRGYRAFYTTPIKALSNQKYLDLVERHGSAAVGLLTGDNTVNGDAPIVVMTTEVLRNMLYGDPAALTNLGYVVMDEVHYLADRFRGAVWEEVIIHLPDPVQLVSLSATVSNAEEFGAWLDTVRGDTTVVVSEHRPVPLWQHVLYRRQLIDLFAEVPGSPSGARVNPALRSLARQDRSRPGRGRRRPPSGQRVRRGTTTSRPQNIITLEREDLLPAITFVFSRAGCDAAVEQCVRAGLWLTTPTERHLIRETVDSRCADIPEEDLGVLGFEDWSHALERGLAAHHAGLLPTFKEVVEDLFSRGLIKAVFATETLALGINMPARSVVLEKLIKWNGQTHAEITPGEYTQLTGRAGRRGIDIEGHAVVAWHPDLDPESVAGLAAKRTYPLRSSFRPTYNMAANLVGQVGRLRARDILQTSFAQFQADRAVVGLATQARQQEEALTGYAEAMRCDRGDFPSYAELRRRITDLEKDLSRSAATQRQRDLRGQIQQLRRKLREHPCHACPDREQHARWAERWWRLTRENQALQRRIEGRTNSIARVFDKVCDLLSELRYLDGDTVTDRGQDLGRLYSESDLLIAECLDEDVWRDLDGPGLAACVSVLVYESRREEAAEITLPPGPVGQAIEDTGRIWFRLVERERAHRLEPIREPDPGLVWAVYRWAQGASLEKVLRGEDLSAGDFVRWVKQVVDLLGQLAQIGATTPGGSRAHLRTAADDAIDRLLRGVVAYSSV
jgi:ATP-dependent RNA helicase HelY